MVTDQVLPILEKLRPARPAVEMRMVRVAGVGESAVEELIGEQLLALDLETGRTHQIRVHLKSLGHPLVGDPVYGEARWKGLPRQVQGPLAAFPRPALHAWRLAFRHPATDEALAFEAPVPADLERLWEETTGTKLPALPGVEG